MKSFFTKIAVVALASLLFAVLLTALADRGLKKSQEYPYSNWNQLLSGKFEHDVVINGNSRARVQLSPKIIDSMLYVNSYNLGIDGYNFYMQSLNYELLFKHNPKPRVIIQVVDWGTLGARADLYMYEQFLPYIDHRADNPFNQYTRSKIGFLTTDYYGITKYSGNFPILLNGLRNLAAPIKTSKHKEDKGYTGRRRAWNEKLAKENAIQFPNGQKAEMDYESVQMFKDFISRCKQNNIQLVLVWPPAYQGETFITNMNAMNELFHHYADLYNIPMLDYSQISLAENRDYFYNQSHMNKDGAELFTKILSEDLKPIVKLDTTKAE